MNFQKLSKVIILVLFTFICTVLPQVLEATENFTAQDLLHIKRCTDVQISPDGKQIAYVVSVPRDITHKPGKAYSELYIANVKTKEISPFITGKNNLSHIRWSYDGEHLGFIAKRGENAHHQVWAIPVKGGESFQISNSKTDISTFEWYPSSKKILFIAKNPKSKKEKLLKEKGYGFTFYEENLKHNNLYIQSIKEESKPVQLTKDITVWDFVIGPKGKNVAMTMSKKNLVDHKYMFKKIHLLDLESQKITPLTDNPGKLGEYSFSPDGARITYTASLDRKDHAVSQLYVIDIASKKVKNLTPPDFRGHVNWARWKNNNTLYFHSGEGVWATLSLISPTGGQRKIIFHGKKTGVNFRTAHFTSDFRHASFIGSNPLVPGNPYYWKPGKKAVALTDLNPWLSKRKLGKQEVIRFIARDDLKIEGLLIYPIDYREGEKYPLVVLVHGGPESHYYNQWISRYATPGQVLANKGYLVFYPNYRASTGYGVKFSLGGYMDAAGKEFDDIADGIMFLTKKGLADKNRVGLGGGSYGGYASAWFATYYTKYVRAVCMFVGITDLVSKRGTTDIPYEELYVHSGKKLEDLWQFSLERSPIYYAHQSKTATLILGGEDDSRVHPSQSMELYRRMKMNHHPSVRWVRYPGEGHGNRKQPGQIDLLYRILDWYDWYVKDQKPLDGKMPPLDISDKYGLKLD